MSQENVEVVRRIYDAYLRGDAATALSAFDPDVEWDTRHHPDGRVYQGHAGIQEFLRDWRNLWESTHSEPEQFLNAGDEVVVVTQEMTRLKDSGLEVTGASRRDLHPSPRQGHPLARFHGRAGRPRSRRVAGVEGERGGDFSRLCRYMRHNCRKSAEARRVAARYRSLID